MVYDRPFWRDEGLTGQGLSPNGLVSATFDDSPPSGNPGVLFGFVGGDQSRRYGRLTATQKRTQVLEELAALFGPKALKAQGVLRHGLGARAVDARVPRSGSGAREP